MKQILFIAAFWFCLVQSQAQSIVIPASQFPIVSTPSNDYRFILVNTNGNTPGSTSSYTQSNATVRYDTLVSSLGVALAGTIGNAANVLQLGAKGGTNDDTAVLASLCAVPGAQLYFPPTNYTVSNSLNVTNGVQLLGRGATIAMTSGVTNKALINFAVGVTNVLIQGFCFDGGYYGDPTSSWTSRSSSSNRTGINLYLNSIGTFIQGIVLRGWDKGMNVYGDQDGLQVFFKGQAFLSQIECFSNYYGIYASSTTTPNEAVEYFRPIQMNIHANTCGFYLAGGNIEAEGFDINGNFWGIIADGNVQNGLHGSILNNLVNHNVNGILVANSGGQSELIALNQIRATVSGASIVLSNASNVTIQGNQFDIGANIVVGASGIPSASKGPNFIHDNQYGGVWGTDLKLFDWNDTGDLVYGNTTNAQHWGNYSYSVSTNADPYVCNPYTMTQILMMPTNFPPVAPFTPNASFMWNSNGTHIFIVRSSGLAWATTNILN